MPTAQNILVAKSSPTLTDVPANKHLLITTRGHVYSWDSTGLHTICTSGQSGIVAAKTAGNGLLAVADSQVIVLHDTKHGQDRSWGLKSAGDEVRLLERTDNGLFFTTRLTNDILRYSTRQLRLRSPVQAHNSAPNVLAGSSAYLVSASDNPPVVYLKNLIHNTKPILLEPRASSTAVCAAAFHPRRAYIFLLAFRDGTIAAYSANEVSRSGCDGEVGHVTGSRLDQIAGCAFLPTHKFRAVSAGADGRCKIVDLEAGTVLRTWHAKAPLTSVSVIEDVIAVGRADGKVHLYDGAGLLLAQKSVSDRVISVEWVDGPSPPPIPDRAVQQLSDAPSIPSNMDGKAQPRRNWARMADSEGLGLPVGLRRPQTEGRKARPDRRFTIHPDEIPDDGTVRYKPASSPPPAALPNGDLLDLFSPVKPSTQAAATTAIINGLSTPLRPRPRISSKTFIESAPMGTADSHATSTASEATRLARGSTIQVSSMRRSSTKLSPLKKRKPSFKPARGLRTDQSNTSALKIGSLAPDDNAKILADLRKMSGALGPKQSGMLRGYATKKLTATDQSHAVTNVPQSDNAEHHLPHKHIRSGTGKQKYWHPGNVLEREATWPTDSVQDESLNDDEDGDDIWLTDEAETQAKYPRSHAQRPPARQVSRSRVTSRGTFSTTRRRKPDLRPSLPNIVPPLRVFDGSTESDAFKTARSQLSPLGVFTPASEDVRELFPRSSSLSSKHKHEPKRHSPQGQRTGLAEMAANAAAARQPNSPWARIRASKNGRSGAHAGVEGQRVEGLIRSPPVRCFDCTKVDARVASLEQDVAVLKGEVLALKALLRRHGIVEHPTSGQRGTSRLRQGR
ncbi:hypothetical protein BAUCODRAFT_25969 [Baudoinia panamericana UAMH 10762]|uniref:WD40 repeat-like protein n=1 Tax=Baudoinia panamericana (strain UAMH 10762) TaxID=717646 RepID=M2N7T8_BAUPA|nr:uncharacterized protein BAUCODRAFT_25969 [Baudoinia panamericana UAMH 10762]EMC94870.1 hypothetical protein BAUCODRAFT_25969 [Baudoinia panamericana UAMH 10762]